MRSQLNLLFQINIRLALFSCLLFFFYQTTAQNRIELEAQRFEIIKEIDNTNKLLIETAQNKKVLASDLSIIDKQIQNRKNLLNQIQTEIELIDQNISLTSEKKLTYEANLDSLKNQYQVLLRAVYREKIMKDPLVSLLSSQSMSASFLKNNYFDRLKQFVANKVEAIKTQQAKLDKEINTLRVEKNNKTTFLLETEKQNKLLVNEQDRQKVLIASLREDEESLRLSLELQKKDREEMNIAIENMIKSEFGSESSTVSGNKADVGNTFAGLKGKLSWPVNGGVISSKYGKQRHPTVKNLTISNNGVDIRAPKGSEVQVIASGKVVSVSEMAGYGKTVIVDHNGYYSVYAKMNQVVVAKGDSIKKDQFIGALIEKNNVSELHFEIWKNNQTLNPETWLK